jgi:hypothetical protein
MGVPDSFEEGRNKPSGNRHRVSVLGVVELSEIPKKGLDGVLNSIKILPLSGVLAKGFDPPVSHPGFRKVGVLWRLVQQAPLSLVAGPQLGVDNVYYRSYISFGH